MIEVSFDMKPRVVKAHQNVDADKGRIAFERGPIVYCAEWPDNDFSIPSILIPANPEIHMADRPEILNGIIELKTQAQSFYYAGNGKLDSKDVTITLIPYYSWLHRGKGEMAVWLPQDVSAVKPIKQPNF